jgi:pimeloyl-ACP methyl ester carboxylesterase
VNSSRSSAALAGPHPRSHVVSAGALSIHVVDYGGDGAPLVAVHGTGLVAQVWEAMVPALRPHFRVLAVDRRGHGESDKPEAGYQLDELVPDYAAVVQHFGLTRPVALGHSTGGSSLGIAAGRHPELFRRLAMVDPIIFPRRDRAGDTTLANSLRLVERTTRRRAEWPDAKAMFEDLATKPVFARWRPEALWAYVRHGARTREDGSVVLKCAPELEASMYRHDGSLDLFEAMTRITVPVLIVRAELTDRLPRASAERAAHMIPHATLVEMAGVGHFAPMEEPECVADLVVPFLLARP